MLSLKFSCFAKIKHFIANEKVNNKRFLRNTYLIKVSNFVQEYFLDRMKTQFIDLLKGIHTLYKQ